MVKTMEASTKRRRKPLKILVSLAFFIRSQGIFSAQKVIIEIIFLEELEKIEKMFGIPMVLTAIPLRQVGENKQQK